MKKYVVISIAFAILLSPMLANDGMPLVNGLTIEENCMRGGDYLQRIEIPFRHTMLSDTLLATYESEEVPLKSNIVENMIQQYFL